MDGSFGALYRVCRDRMGWKEPDLHRLDHLDEGLAEELFLPKGAVSATRMERYARCPFSHFVESGLRPQEIREPGVAPRDRGDILHEALEKVVALRKGDWTLGREEIQKLALEVVEKIADISARFIVNRASLKTKQKQVDEIIGALTR